MSKGKKQRSIILQTDSLDSLLAAIKLKEQVSLRSMVVRNSIVSKGLITTLRNRLPGMPGQKIFNDPVMNIYKSKEKVLPWLQISP